MSQIEIFRKPTIVSNSNTDDGKKNKEKKEHKDLWKKILIIIGAAIAALILIVALAFRTKTIIYEGNKHVSEAVLNEAIFDNKMPNSIIFKLFGGNNEYIPFVESYSVHMESNDTLLVDIKEKNIVCCAVGDDGKICYIDDTGKVTDILDEKFEDIPVVKGITFNTLEKDKVPETDNDESYKKIINYAKELKNYTQSNYVLGAASDGGVNIKIGNVLVRCGDDEYVEDKLVRLSRLIPQFTDFNGTLHLEDFDGTQTDIYFKKADG